MDKLIAGLPRSIKFAQVKRGMGRTNSSPIRPLTLLIGKNWTKYIQFELLGRTLKHSQHTVILSVLYLKNYVNKNVLNVRIPLGFSQAGENCWKSP